jgi:hypothetical protein
VTVFLAAPVMRTVERIELPSTRQPMISARLDVVSLFMPPICMSKRSFSSTAYNKVCICRFPAPRVGFGA